MREGPERPGGARQPSKAQVARETEAGELGQRAGVGKKEDVLEHLKCHWTPE